MRTYKMKVYLLIVLNECAWCITSECKKVWFVNRVLPILNDKIAEILAVQRLQVTHH